MGNNAKRGTCSAAGNILGSSEVLLVCFRLLQKGRKSVKGYTSLIWFTAQNNYVDAGRLDEENNKPSMTAHLL